MRYRITTPEPMFRGEVAGVVFTDGAGETADRAALAYFSRKGYGVHPVESASGEKKADDKPRKSASKADWLAYAIIQGHNEDVVSPLTRDQLVELVADDEGEDQ